MNQLFTPSEYAHLHSLVFRNDYPGYTSNVVEAPNGDGNKDLEKRYAHVAYKYLASDSGVDKQTKNILTDYLEKAHALAIEVAIAIGVPSAFWPVREYGALRVLEYNSIATTAPHKDFDLFTLMCYRNLPDYFKYISQDASQYKKNKALHSAQKLNSQVHFGEILEEIDPDTFQATPHEVVASKGPYQYSVVYFSIPSHDAVLKSGVTVGEWLKERMSRSRYER